MTEQIIVLILFFGLPLLWFSSCLHYWAYEKDYLELDEDDLKTSLKERSKQQKQSDESESFLLSKWMQFGGGFYGIVTFATYIYIELSEVIQFFMQLESVAQVKALLSFGTLLNAFIQSFLNFVPAFTWFAFWPDFVVIDNFFVWIGIMYICYQIGLKLAKHLYIREQYYG